MNSVAPTLQTLASQWAEQQTLASQPALESAQIKARMRLREMRFPDRKTEAWKYTSLLPLANPALWHTGKNDGFEAPADALNVEAALRLRFINGTLINPAEEEAPSAIPDGIELLAFSQLNAAQLERYLPLTDLNSQWKDHPFAQLSEAMLDQTWLLIIQADQRQEKPIVIEQWASAGSDSFTANLRVLIVVEKGAEAALLHMTDTTHGAPDALLNSLLQVHLHDNARLQHIQLQVADEQCHQVLGTHAVLGRDSNYQHFAISLGTALIRNDLHIKFTAPGAEATLSGAFLCKHTQHIDNHITLEHLSGRCQSNTRYKGLITDSAKAVFNGRIHIHPNAQKTDAQLSNKNLLLSPNAEIDTKPELEIYADDVKCAHGASIGQLDEKALFYFETRGIDKATAEAMLSFGFINEIVKTLPLQGISEALTTRLVAYFRDVKQLGDLWQA